MHYVGLFFAEQVAQAKSEPQVVIASAFEMANRDVIQLCSGADRGIGRTREDAFDAAADQSADQPEDLLRTAIKVPAGFNVYDFHQLFRASTSRLPKASMTRSPRRQ
jgi:hypothetical protein